jgi:hypothetical protein
MRTTVRSLAMRTVLADCSCLAKMEMRVSLFLAPDVICDMGADNARSRAG